MSSPKHLWSGDWEQDSEDAARDRAGRRIDFPEPFEPAPPRPVPAPAPEQIVVPNRVAVPERVAVPNRAAVPERVAVPKREPRRPRNSPRLRLPRAQVVLISLLALALLAGAAYGLTSIHDSESTPASSTSWLGAKLENWPAGGALIGAVVPGSPAASAGLKPGDLIIQVQGRPVVSPVNVDAAVAALGVGDTLQIQAARGGSTYSTNVTLAARPPDKR